MPASGDPGGYYNKGVLVPSVGKFQPASNFNDRTMTPWLTASKGVNFDQSKGRITAQWANPTNTSAMFYLTGSASNIEIVGMRLFVPEDAGADRFIPVCFQSSNNYNSNLTITATMPVNSTTSSVPNNIRVTDLDIDGSYMGWVGALQNTTFNQDPIS